MNCPSCTTHAWPSDTRGLRTCPACHSTVALTKRGAILKGVILGRSRVGQANVAQVRIKSTPVHSRTDAKVRRLFEVVGDGVNPQSLPEGVILCSCCGKRTSILQSIDGRIDSADYSRSMAEVGKRYIAPDTLVPRYEERAVPRSVRGMICFPCVAEYGARRIEHPKDRRKLVWREAGMSHYNRAVQRAAAEKLERYLAYCLMAGVEPNPEMVYAIEAKHRRPDGTIECSAAGWSGVKLIETRYLTGAEYLGGRELARAVARTKTGYVLVGRPWFMTRTIASVNEDREGRPVVETVAVSHPALCPCSDCLRGVHVRPFNPISHVDRARYRGPAEAGCRWSGRLQRRVVRLGVLSLPEAPKPLVVPVLAFGGLPVRRRRPYYRERGKVYLRVLSVEVIQREAIIRPDGGVTYRPRASVNLPGGGVWLPRFLPAPWPEAR